MTRAKRFWRWVWCGAVLVSAVMMLAVGVVYVASFMVSPGLSLMGHRAVSWTESPRTIELQMSFSVHQGNLWTTGRWYTWETTDILCFDIVEGIMFEFLPSHGQKLSENTTDLHDHTIGNISFQLSELDPMTYWLGKLPLYYPLATAAILPTLWLYPRYANRHKRLPNHCHQCGYDLTGTLAAGRSECPECGAVVEKGAKAK